MTLAQMLVDLNSRIGSEPEIDNADLITWINQGLLTFCNTYDYYWLKKVAYASTVANQDEYTLPSDMKRLLELKIDSNRYQYVRYEQRDIQPTSKKYFSILGNSMFINPTPDTTGSANIEMSYVKRPSKMTFITQSPGDSDVASLPEVYQEALILYAFSIYNTYDEEHDEARLLMGNELRPSPGTFYYFVKLARAEEEQRKRGSRNRFLSTKEYYGYNHPDKIGNEGTVLGN